MFSTSIGDQSYVTDLKNGQVWKISTKNGTMEPLLKPILKGGRLQKMPGLAGIVSDAKGNLIAASTHANQESFLEIFQQDQHVKTIKLAGDKSLSGMCLANQFLYICDLTHRAIDIYSITKKPIKVLRRKGN